VLKGRERAGAHGYVPVALRVGRDRFADIAAAVASQEAAYECRRSTEGHVLAHGTTLYTFPAPPGLRGLVEVRGRLSNNRFSAIATVSGLVEAGAPGAEYFYELCSTCTVELHFSYISNRGLVTLKLFFAGGKKEGADPGSLYLPQPIVVIADISGGSKLGVNLVSVFGGDASAAQLLDLVVWLANNSKGDWEDAAASAAADTAAVLFPVVSAASHAVQIASRIQAAGLDYPAVKEAAEEARARALEAYSAIAEKAAMGQGLPLAHIAKMITGGHLGARKILKAVKAATRPGAAESTISSALAEAEEHLTKAVRIAAAARATSEVLASLSEPD